MNHTDLQMPVIPAAKAFQHPTPELHVLNNGIQLWYLENTMIPLMSMKLVFDAGSFLDDASKAGIVALTSAMLKEGANGKSAQQISDQIEDLGATLFVSTTQDNSYIDLQSLSEEFPKGLEIVADIWQKADFLETDFSRLKRIWLNKLKTRADSPEASAKLASNLDFFGPKHPYAMPGEGYQATVEAITLEDLKSHYDKHLKSAKPFIVATGSIPTAELLALLNKHFGKLELDAKPTPAPQIPLRKHVKSLVIVDKADAPQSIIRIALPSKPASDPSILAIKLANIPFGGSFTSRLMQNIREDKGYTYGAYAAIADLKYDGFMIAQASVASEVTGPALIEFIHEFNQLVTGDFSAEEFERAKATWQSELVQTFETQSGTVGIFTSLLSNGLSVDVINDFAQKLPQMTLEEFQKVARAFPTLDQASITIVGDKSKILEQIKDLDLSEAKFRDAQGFPIEK